MTYREWTTRCPKCDTVAKIWDWSDKLPLPCPTCTTSTYLYIETKGDAPGIATDSLVGGLDVRHGVCWPDGSPRRFDSKTDLKRALNEAGLSIKGDTPKPYKVGWSGKAIDPSTNKAIE